MTMSRPNIFRKCNDILRLDHTWKQEAANIKDSLRLLELSADRTNRISELCFSKQKNARINAANRLFGALNRTKMLHQNLPQELNKLDKADSLLLESYNSVLNVARLQFDFRVSWYLFNQMKNHPNVTPNETTFEYLFGSYRFPFSQSTVMLDPPSFAKCVGEDSKDEASPPLSDFANLFGLSLSENINLRSKVTDKRLFDYYSTIINSSEYKNLAQESSMGFDKLINLCKYNDILVLLETASDSKLNIQVQNSLHSTAISRIKTEGGALQDLVAVLSHALDNDIGLSLEDLRNSIYMIDPFETDESDAFFLMDTFILTYREKFKDVQSQQLVHAMVVSLLYCQRYQNHEKLKEYFNILLTDHGDVVVGKLSAPKLKQLSFALSWLELDAITAYDDLFEKLLNSEYATPDRAAMFSKTILFGLGHIARRLRNYQESQYRRSHNLILSNTIGDATSNTISELDLNVELARDDLVHASDMYMQQIVGAGVPSEQAYQIMCKFYIHVHRPHLAEALIAKKGPKESELSRSKDLQLFNDLIKDNIDNPHDAVRLVGEMQSYCQPNSFTLRHLVNSFISNRDFASIRSEDLQNLCGVLISLCRIYKIKPESGTLMMLLEVLKRKSLPEAIYISDLAEEFEVELESDNASILH